MSRPRIELPPGPSFMETLKCASNNLLRAPMAALRGVGSVRLALYPARGFIQRFLIVRLRTIAWRAVCMLAGGLAVLATASASSMPVPADEARVIVRFHADPAGRKQVQSTERARALSNRLGLNLATVSEPAPGVVVLRAQGLAADALAQRLATLDEVAYAQPDRRKRVRSTPNDPLLPRQWYLHAAEPSASRVVAAWTRLPASAGPVVAVIDTGVRPEHEDLLGRLLPGYDFVSDPRAGNDGDGRDNDPTDPGDFVTQQDLRDPFFAGCAREQSSWHGTQVGGIVAATSHNGIGIAGIARDSRLLPVRALGKCGGFDSDIIAALRWAAGLPVPGVPDNPNPARVINLSLGAPGRCGPLYSETLAEIHARGALVVAAAGNDAAPVEEPANCPGVLAVAGLRHNGIKVGYSALGPEVSLSAPAGNCVQESGECMYPLVTTTNLGIHQPGANGYSDGFKPTLGTSFAAPQVAAVAALMWQAHPGLPRAELSRRLLASARPFPNDPAVPTCPALGAAGSAIDGQCNCTPTTCGAGMLDAEAAQAEALRPLAVIQGPEGARSGAEITLDGGASLAAAGRSITAWRWRMLAGPSGASLNGADKAQMQITASQAGEYRIELEVTDSRGATDATAHVLRIEASASGGGGGGGGSLDVLGLVLLSGLLAPFYRLRRKSA